MRSSIDQVETPIARVLDKARQKIADAKEKIERLEKWRPLEVTPAALATFHYVHGLIRTDPK